MSRLRLNGLGSASNALTASAGTSGVAQTISFGSDPGFPTIAFPDILEVTAAPGTSAEEVMWVTTWTAGATSGTAIRNAEPTKTGQNSAAAQSGVAWECAPTSLDFGGLASPLGLQIAPANFPNWRKAVADVLAGVGSAKILSIGTSISAGGGVQPPAQLAPPALLAKLINANFCPCFNTAGIPTPYTLSGAGAVNYDPRFTAGTGWTFPATNGSGSGIGWANNGYVIGALSAAGALTYTPDPAQNVDSFDVWYYSASNTGTVQGSVDGGSNTAIVTNNASAAFRKTTVSCTRGVGHVLSLATVTVDPVYIVAIEAYDSTVPSLHVWNAGVDGLGLAANWDAGSPVALIEAVSPALTLIELGGDDTLAGTPPTAAAFLTSLQGIITAAQNSGAGDVLLWSQGMVNPSAGGITGTMITNLESYIYELMLEAVAAPVGYVDIAGRWVSYAVSNPLGFFYTDGIHPSAVGNADIAATLFRALETLTQGTPNTAMPASEYQPTIYTVSNAASSVTPTAAMDEVDWTTSATGTITINNPTGTPFNGQRMIVRVKTSGGAETYSFGTAFRGSTAQALPTTSSNNKWDYMGFKYNATDSKWDLLALNQGF